MKELVLGNLHFTNHCPSGRTESIASVRRVSDGHHVGTQSWFARELTDEELAEFARRWAEENEGIENEPQPVLCFACGATLVSDYDTSYQFDNVLWIGLHGGYGMFVDACDYPLNTTDAYLRQENGNLLLDEFEEPVRDPAWEPEYEEERILPGRPDIEAVICHECAHSLCETVPWLASIIRPEKSHAHHYAQHESLVAEGHVGWDLKSDMADI